MSTALGIIKSAMRKAGVLVKSETPSSDEANDGLEMLNDLLASLSNEGMMVYARTLDSFSLSGGVSDYTIGTGGVFNTTRPTHIAAGYVRSGDIDYPLQVVSEENYSSVSIKTTQGTPEYLVYTNAYPLATIKLYPTPVGGETLFLLTEKPLASFTLNEAVDLPPGWRRMLIHNLAVEISSEYGQTVPPEVFSIANESKAVIKQAISIARKFEYKTGLESTGNIYSGWY